LDYQCIIEEIRERILKFLESNKNENSLPELLKCSEVEDSPEREEYGYECLHLEKIRKISNKEPNDALQDVRKRKPNPKISS
jgi:hypothetical protein